VAGVSACRSATRAARAGALTIDGAVITTRCAAIRDARAIEDAVVAAFRGAIIDTFADRLTPIFAHEPTLTTATRAIGAEAIVVVARRSDDAEEQENESSPRCCHACPLTRACRSNSAIAEIASRLPGK